MPNYSFSGTSTGGTLSGFTPSDYIIVSGTSEYESGVTSASIEKKKGIRPTLYFKYIKKKFKILERMKIDGRLKKLEKACYTAMDNGQDALAEKFMREIAINLREAMMFGKGVKYYISKEDVERHKRNIRKGHISDTKYESYTRHIPKNIVDKKKAVEELFDELIIYHYWNEDAEDVKKMTKEERAEMKDPVLFGRIKELPDRLYFIAEWIDDLCDLSFGELVDALSLEDEDCTTTINFNNIPNEDV